MYVQPPLHRDRERQHEEETRRRRIEEHRAGAKESVTTDVAVAPDVGEARGHAVQDLHLVLQVAHVVDDEVVPHARREVFVDPDRGDGGTDHHHQVGGAAHEVVGEIGVPRREKQQHEPGALAESERSNTRRCGRARREQARHDRVDADDRHVGERALVELVEAAARCGKPAHTGDHHADAEGFLPPREWSHQLRGHAPCVELREQQRLER